MKNVVRATIISSLLLWGYAQADTVTFYVDSENDCAGVYGQGFDTCEIGALVLSQGTGPGGKDEYVVSIGISPIIVKYDTEGPEGDLTFKTPEINSLFPDVDGSEIALTGSGSYATGTWTYTQGTGDPGIRFWVAKAGNGFNVFYDLSAADISACGGDFSTNACMQLANIVTTGRWNTPGDKGLSHISFYDTDGVTVPEPGTMALLGLGLLGMGLARRRIRS